MIIDIIYTEAEDPIYRVLMQKWQQHNHLQEKLREIVKEYGLSDQLAAIRMARSIGVERVEVKGKNYIAVNNDCCEETSRMDNNSVDLIVTSIPFSNHYEYTASYNDFGHNEDTERFFEQMDYLSPNLLRILKPGRVFACHVKDRVLFGNATGMGMPTMEPFHAQCIEHYMRHGFAYMGMITVVTDVVCGRTTRPTGLAGRSNAKTAARWALAARNISCCSVSCRLTARRRMQMIRL